MMIYKIPEGNIHVAFDIARGEGEPEKHYSQETTFNEQKKASETIRFSYDVDFDTGKIKIRVYNYLTGEVIQEIPSEEFLSFIKELKENIDKEYIKRNGIVPEGLFLDNTV